MSHPSTPRANPPSVTLVGAGPGDPDLLTVGGLRALRSADAVLYDALAGEALLAEVPARAPRIYVGKRCGRHALRQPDINALLIATARRHGHVVRLKGGDAFVFGRGGEEVAALHAAGIPTRVIPGVSSAIAAPALAGVPLTHRGVSRGFWVLTATTKDHALPPDIAAAARSPATVVILMGTRCIAEIAAVFRAHRHAETPFALLQNASRPDARRTVGTLGDPGDLIAAATSRQPGVLVVGEVVGALPYDWISASAASRSAGVLAL